MYTSCSYFSSPAKLFNNFTSFLCSVTKGTGAQPRAREAAPPNQGEDDSCDFSEVIASAATLEQAVAISLIHLFESYEDEIEEAFHHILLSAQNHPDTALKLLSCLPIP